MARPKKELKLTCLQFLNEMKLIGITRKVIEDRFSKSQFTKGDWISELEKFGIKL